MNEDFKDSPYKICGVYYAENGERLYTVSECVEIIRGLLICQGITKIFRRFLGGDK